MIGAAMAAALACAPADDVAGLAWMAGAWTQDRDGGVVRETWLAPSDGLMSGVGQTSRPRRKGFTEFMTISAETAGATFTALIPGQPPTAFVLIPGGSDQMVFENKAHDFPRRVIYRRCGADLCGRIEGTVKGKAHSQDWRFTRIAP